jgi:hypothetical protein
MNQKNLIEIQRVTACSLLFMSVIILAGCNRGADSQSDSASDTGQQQSSTAPVPIDPFSNMATAVYLTKAEQPVDMRFEFTTTPKAAQPIQIKLNLLALMDITELQLKLSSPDELAISTDAQANYAALKQGESWAPTLELTSKSNGLYLLNVELQAMAASGEHTFKYVIPIPITTTDSSSASLAAPTKT